VSGGSAPSGRAARAALPAILLIGVGAASLLGRAFFFEPPEVSPEQWAEVAAGALARAGERDAARAFPTWDDAATVHLGGFGERLVTERELVPEDLAAWDAVWLFTTADREEDARAGLPFEAWAVGERVTAGEAVAVRLEVPASMRAKARLRDLVPEARVSRVEGDEVTECGRWDVRLEAWVCGKRDGDHHVGVAYADVGGEVRPCVWAYPPKGGGTWRVRFPGVELGERFVLRAAPTMRGWRKAKEGEVRLGVRVGEVELVDRVVPMGEYGQWEAYELGTAPRRGERVDVVVEVGARVGKDRKFCFDGWVF
jgi:hypothetical protein